MLLIAGQRRLDIECKWGDAPDITKSMRTALADLRLNALAIVYPSERRAALDERIELVPPAQLDAFLQEQRLWQPQRVRSGSRR